MLRKNWEKIDSFYVIFAFVMVLMTGLIIIAFKVIFSAYLGASEISSKDTQVSAEIKKDVLEEAYNWARQKESVSLEIRE